jgi:hypothetical protein
LFDIEEAYHNNDNLVLISARYKSGFIDTPEIRLAEVPSEIDTTKY